MIKEIKAIYEAGMIRPLEPLNLPDGTHLDIIVVTHEDVRTDSTAAEILAGIAALPLEASNDAFAGSEHDSILYPNK